MPDPRPPETATPPRHPSQSRLALRRVRRVVNVWLAVFLGPLYRRKNVGRRSRIDRSAQILGWKSIRLGHHVLIGENCWLNVNFPNAEQPCLTIGNYSMIGRRNMISSGMRLTLGDYTLTGPDCRLIGADHVYDDPFRPYISTGAAPGGTIEVGDNCWLGAAVQVIGSVKIGRGSVIGAGSLVTRDVPPFSVAVGSPARVLKRFDMSSMRWIRAEDFTSEMERLLPSSTDYLASLRSATPTVEMPYLATGFRAGNAL